MIKVILTNKKVLTYRSGAQAVFGNDGILVVTNENGNWIGKIPREQIERVDSVWPTVSREPMPRLKK